MSRTNHTLYHCVHVQKGVVGEVRQYSIGRGYDFYSGEAGSLGFQTYAHTNWPRDPGIGLPGGWTFHVKRLRARVSTLAHADWMDSVALVWSVEQKNVAEVSLAELVLGGRDAGFTLESPRSLYCRIEVSVRAPATLRIWPQLDGELERP